MKLHLGHTSIPVARRTPTFCQYPLAKSNLSSMFSIKIPYINNGKFQSNVTGTKTV